MRIKRCYLSYKQAQSTVIRVGDRVVVTVPEFVERVGYPLV